MVDQRMGFACVRADHMGKLRENGSDELISWKEQNINLNLTDSGQTFTVRCTSPIDVE